MIRDLTDQEVANVKPHLNYYYFAPTSDRVPFYSIGKPGIESRLIERPAFELCKHSFSDDDIASCEIDGYANNEYLHFTFEHDTDELTHNRDDVIAMAKALQLTPEEIKR